ncbi:MAG: ligand-binding sensor domain-containing protein, partial [Gemmatimonadaceae bacterium]
RDITEGRDGRLIVATSGGVCTLDGSRLTCVGQKEGLVSNTTRSLSIDTAGGVWVGTERGVAHLSNGRIRNYTTADGLPAEHVLRVVVDSNNVVWVATDRGLARLMGERFVPDTVGGLGSASIQFIAHAGRGLLVGVEGQLFLHRGDSATAVAEGSIPEGTSFVDGAVDRDGTIWVATRVGALRIRNREVAHVGKANGLPTDLLNRVYVDREGDVWFGTESGASKHVPGPFRTYTDAAGLPSPFVRVIEVDHEGRLWAGTRNGVAVLEGERFTPLPLPGVLENRVYAIARESSGGMLIGTRRGLVHFKKGAIRVYHEHDGLPGPVVYSFAADGRGGAWIGTDRGLAHWDNGRITAVDRADLAKLSIVSMARDSRGRLWMGRLEGGLALMDGDSVRLLGAEENFTNQAVWALKEDGQGRMWAVTNGDGALRIDDGGVRAFTMKDGLASNFVWQVLPDSRGDIWLFGNLGLNRISGDRITHYGRGSGLIELEGSAGASFEDAAGILWFGTGSGAVRYEPGLDIIPAAAPPIYIEGATQDGQAFPMHGARVSQGVIRIAFAAPSFRDESAIRFRYRLIGANDSWSSPTPERSITYAGLGPGAYRFEAVAVNPAGQSSVPASLSFEVLPTFWQTWWFRLIAVSLLLGAAAAIPAWRARALEHERQRLEALV